MTMRSSALTDDLWFMLGVVVIAAAAYAVHWFVEGH